MTAEELAKKSGYSRATIYARARKLGRLPTLEELKEKPKKGRPYKYDSKK